LGEPNILAFIVATPRDHDSAAQIRLLCELMFLQMRAILQQFVDHDKDRGIRVLAKDKVKVYLLLKRSNRWCSLAYQC
jgi:hypothetical protein